MTATHGFEGAGDRKSRFVCVFNRDRDFYQVPLALEEAGLLEALVTDYYAPDRPPRWLPGFLARKRHPRLPRNRTLSDRLAFVGQYAAQALRLPMHNVWQHIDARLGRVAGRLAKRRRTHLYCYHHYLPDRVEEDCCLIVFVFHPLQQSYLAALEQDHARFPETRESFLAEQASAEVFRLPVAWDRPAAYVCASQVTARSLIEAGAPADRIAVIPYGLPPLEDLAPGSGLNWPEARFLFVGQGVQRKGLHHLIRAWQARDRGDASLTIVSYAADPGIAALARSPSIRILGHQRSDVLARIFRESDIFAMPSLVEGFGLVYSEALARGCHLLATPNTGVPDLRLDSASATLVDSGDLAALDEAITDLIERKRAGGLNRTAIVAAGNRWTQADFRAAIADHAAALLKWHGGKGPYPSNAVPLRAGTEGE